MRMMVPTDLEAIKQTLAVFLKMPGEHTAKSRPEPKSSRPLRAPDRMTGTSRSRALWSGILASKSPTKSPGRCWRASLGEHSASSASTPLMAPFVKMERYSTDPWRCEERQSRGGTAASVFTSLKHGLQRLIEGMTATIPSSMIRLNEEVKTIIPKVGKWEVTSASSSAQLDQIVWLTTGPVRLLAASSRQGNTELRNPGLKVEATSAVVAAFAFDREQSAKLRIPEGFGFLVPQGYGCSAAHRSPRLLACTFVDQKFSHRAPEGCVVLRAFYGGSSAPQLLAHPDDFILSLARRHLSDVLGEVPQNAKSSSSAAGRSESRSTLSGIAARWRAGSRRSSRNNPVFT